MPKRGELRVDLTGRVFGRWTVLGFSSRIRRQAHWLCRCACGVEREVSGQNLHCGGSVSCGCFADEVRASSARHGECRTSGQTVEYRSWSYMLSRVRDQDPNSHRFRLYASRGITVCDRWLKFENFLADMGRRPSPDHSLDRYPDPYGNYEPNNCRWATRSEQRRNQRVHIPQNDTETPPAAA
jgi:hypothetical protein